MEERLVLAVGGLATTAATCGGSARMANGDAVVAMAHRGVVLTGGEGAPTTYIVDHRCATSGHQATKRQQQATLRIAREHVVYTIFRAEIGRGRT